MFPEPFTIVQSCTPRLGTEIKRKRIYSKKIFSTDNVDLQESRFVPISKKKVQEASELFNGTKIATPIKIIVE